jgi:hypothetical protein
MKIVLYRKNKFGIFYITDYVSNIKYTHTSAYHLATVFNTLAQKDEIDYLKNTFGFDYKASKFDVVVFEQSKNLQRIYID